MIQMSAKIAKKINYKFKDKVATQLTRWAIMKLM